MFNTQLGDNLHNLLLSLKQVHLKQTDSLNDQVLDYLFKHAAKFKSEHLNLAELPKQPKDIFKHLSKCIGLYCKQIHNSVPSSKDQIASEQ